MATALAQQTQPTRSQPAPPRPARAAVLAAATLTSMAEAIIAPSLPAMREAFAGTPGADLWSASR